jgi:hypothetical protein
MATNHQLEMQRLDGEHGGKTIREVIGRDDRDAAFAIGQLLGRTGSDQQLRHILAGWLSRGSESALIANMSAAFEFAANEADSQREHDHWLAIAQWIAQSPD